ncbi:MAG: SRPBCC family protein [Planctomycetota bacterium]
MNLTIHEVVDAPIEQVFDVFSNFRDAADRVEGIKRVEMITDGPIGLGSRFRETRVMFGREATEEMEITRFQPNKEYVVEAESCGAHFQTVFRFRPEGDQTSVEMEMTTRAITVMAKLMSPLSFMMAGTMKKCVLDDIRQLKQYCEAHDVVDAAAMAHGG